MMKKFLLIILLLSVTSIYSQNTGKLSGKIIDIADNEPLIGVNILLKGTYYGAASDINGNFVIPNITPGDYNITVSFIGYKTMEYAGYKIAAGKTTELNVKMSQTSLTLDQDVVVIGSKPLLDVNETQSKTTISSDDIKNSLVENIQDIVSQQAGIVHSDNEIHIRGGRAYENAYLLNGVSVQDPLAGTGFGLQLSTNAIKEVEIITGGINAEYGQATSGVVNVTTKEGGDNYSGFISYKTDNLGNKSSPYVFNSKMMEIDLGGPEPITSSLLPMLGINIPGKLTFFTSFYMGLTDGITQGYYKPTAGRLNSTTFFGTRFAPEASNNWYWLAKFTYKPSSTFKISYSFNQSVSISQNTGALQTNLEHVEPSPGYQYTFQNILPQANVYTHDNKYNTVNITHTLNASTYYDLSFNYFYTNLRADANGRNWYDYIQPKDIPNFPIQYYNTDRDTIGVIPGDGFWDIGNPYTWHDHFVEEYSIRGNITSFFDERNKFKAGFEFQFQEMQVVDIYQPWIGDLGLNNDIYKVYPAMGSFYAQDNINFSGMILNFGLRMDYWFPGKYVDDAVENPDVVTIPDQTRQDYLNDTFGWFGNRRWKARLSPRLGISHPVSDNQTLFFSYGHFSKWPRPQFVYAKLNPLNAQSSFQQFGNPNLNPETTVAYELGLKTQFTPDDVITITAYYKDIFDYINTRTAKITSARFISKNFITYVNSDYARSRGLELEFKKRIGKWFNGTISATYAIITGKSSSSDEGALVIQGDVNESVKEKYMPWDRPFTVSVNTNFYVGKGEALFGFGNGILDDYNLYLRLFFESGKRYTPAYFTGYDTEGRPVYLGSTTDFYTDIAQNWFWVDLNFEKYIPIGSLDLSFTIEINNLFDIQNSAIINPATGKAYQTGDPVPYSWNDPLYPNLQAPISPYPYDPSRYLTRRNVKLGLSLKF
jgi:outer membrane receptor protein involved in Fe transport